jgi:hypothetical protein
MEAVGLVASVIAIVQLTEACLKLSSKLTGPSSYKPERLQSLSTTLYNFNGTIKNLQTHLEIHEDDQARLDGMTPGSEIFLKGKITALKERIQSFSHRFCI